MRRVGAWIVLACILASAPAGTHAVAAEPKVVVTIKPLHALVAQVMAGVGTPTLLVQGLASSHTYSLRPSEARTLNGADVLVRMSETVEPFTSKIVRSLPASVEVVTLQDTPRLKLLQRRTDAVFSPHPHEERHDDDNGHAPEHAHGAIDGHAWLDPDNAIAMVDRIEQALSIRYPDHAARFAANADGLKARLEALSRELARDLKPIASRPYIVFHDATQYLERRYGLNVVGSISMSPEIAPSGKRLTELRRKIDELGAVCVFAEPQFDTRLVANLIEGTSARSGTFDPEGGRLEPGPELYFTLMRQLAGDLKGCLAPPA